MASREREGWPNDMFGSRLTPEGELNPANAVFAWPVWSIAWVGSTLQLMFVTCGGNEDLHHSPELLKLLGKSVGFAQAFSGG
jgi:hypothetical protein